MPSGIQVSEPSILSLNQLTADASLSPRQGNAAAAGSRSVHDSRHRTAPQRSPRETPDHRSAAELRTGAATAAHVIDLTAEDSASPSSSADSGVLTLPAQCQSTPAAGHERIQHQALVGGVRPARHSARTEQRLSEQPDAADAAVPAHMQTRHDTHSDPVVACTRKRRRWDVGPPGTALGAVPWPSGQQSPAERNQRHHHPLPGPSVSVRYNSDAVPASMARVVDRLVDRPQRMQHASGNGTESFRVSRHEQDQQESHLPVRQLPSAPDQLYKDTQHQRKRTRHDSADRQSRLERGHRQASQRCNNHAKLARHEKSHRHKRSRSGQDLCRHSGCQQEVAVKIVHSGDGEEPHAHRTQDADCYSDTASHAQDRWQLWQSEEEARLH